jgi:hypothetical protein
LAASRILAGCNHQIQIANRWDRFELMTIESVRGMNHLPDWQEVLQHRGEKMNASAEEMQ